MADGIHEMFFYVHIRGCIRFHFFDLHRNGRVRLYGGSYQNGPVTSSGWHGIWLTIDDFLGDDNYVAAMQLHFSYLGNDAREFHHIVAGSCRDFPDCWVLFEDGVPHAVMYRIPRPAHGVPVAFHEL